MRHHRLLPILVPACLCLLLAGGCSRTVTGDPAAKPSKGPWAVNGIRLNTSLDACRSRLGDPAESRPQSNGKVFCRWSRPPGFTIVFTDDLATEISGTTLTDTAGVAVLDGGADETTIAAVLPNARRQRHYAPSGSGVIAIGRKLTGTSYTVSDDLGTFELSCRDGFIVGVHCRPVQ